MQPHVMVRLWRVLALTILLASLFFSAAGCDVVAPLWLPASPTATATSTSTPTATPTATATSTPTYTPTPTAEPLHLSVNLVPPQVRQGHTLLIEVWSNRAITVTGFLDERPLLFVPESAGAWTVSGIPAVAEEGAQTIQLSIVDSLGVSISTTVSVMVEVADFGTEQVYIPADRVSLLDPKVSQEEAQRLERIFASITPQQFWQSTFIWPYNGRVTSPFGMRRTYNDGQRSYHGGIDIAGDGDAPPVAASNHSRVALAAPLRVHGNAVILDHGWGVYSAYYHLSEILVSEGQEVAQGETIGRMGDTGLSTGMHLHWEMRVGGVCVNPLEWTSRQIPR